MSEQPVIHQSHATLKRVLLAPVAPLARRWALAGEPTRGKAKVVRRLVVPQVGAQAANYEGEYAPGFRYAGNTQDLLGLMVNLFGVWEPNLSAFLQSRLAPGDTFIDVGANSGWFTSMGAALVGARGHVVGVEASPIIAERLQANLDRNNFAHARVLVAAVMRGPGVVDIVPGPAEHTGLTRIQATHSAGAIQVQGDRLQELLTADEIAHARVVKIDVEGAEYDVVGGLADALPRFRDDCEFVVEVGPERAEAPSDVERLVAAFTDRGFRAYALPNFYDVHSYMLEPVARVLEPVSLPLEHETDIVFSRLGAETLSL